MSHDKDSLQNTVKVSLLLCVVCSIVVSSAAVMLKEMQQANEEMFRARNVLTAAGLYDPDKHDAAYVQQAFDAISVRLIDLASGNYLTDEEIAGYGIDAATFDANRAARDPQFSVSLSSSEDIASIRRFAKIAQVYVFEKDGEVERVVLPVYGAGLWDTMYAFLALEGDGSTILGLSFYEHAETPGLGGEVDNPVWKAQWPGLQAFGEDGEVIVEVTKAGQATDPDGQQVDGLSGSTLTTVGVHNLVRFWLGERGFGPYLARLQAGEV